MANIITFWLTLIAFCSVVQCMVSSGRNGHGLIGYGINMYSPVCCTACRNVLSSSKLNCSEVMNMEGMAGMDMGDSDFATSLECFATDDAFLQSLAVCISERCHQDSRNRGQLKEWQIEEWWQKNVVGNQAQQPDPKETYQQALAKVEIIPTEALILGNPLNRTMLVADEDYQPNWNADVVFEDMEITHQRYALVVFLSGVVIPVGFSLFRFLPFPARWVSLFNAWVIDPPAFGRHHKVPVFFGLVTLPARGQALFIIYLITINIILSATGYQSRQPNAWWPDDPKLEILTYVSNRLGVLSFANVPLLILYAGRNNVLLWLTNWSHDTFLLVHRYVAGIATLQAALHSAIYLQIYVAKDQHTSESQLSYWYWGIIATLGMSILMPTSILPLRRMMYEAFLLWHIAISVLVVVGCYLHIYDRFQHQWGYEVWIYVALAVWVFDRVLRVFRLCRNGIRWANISTIDNDYLRVDIEGTCGSHGHAYLYFPTLTWRVWENHPFSVASTVLPRETRKAGRQMSITDVEKSGSKVVVPSAVSDGDSDTASQWEPPTQSLTFLLRTRGGLTALLRSQRRIPVLVESPYRSNSELLEYSTLICVAGGVGITTVLPLLHSHPGHNKLLWGVRSGGIVEAMSRDMIGIDKKVFVANRMNVREELEKEVSHAGDTAVVVVSGPDSMADDVRNAVCEIGRQGKNISIRLVEESFSW